MGTGDNQEEAAMSGIGRDQEAERVEDYLEFERHVERLQQEKRPRRPRRMTPGQARAYRMAAFLRSAAPGAAEPSAEFAARLSAQVDQELGGRRLWFRALLPGGSGRGVSRRALLSSGLSAAAGLAAGVVLGGVVEQKIAAAAPPPTTWQNTPLVGLGKDWLLVGAVAEIAPGQMRQFRTETVVGYLFHNDEVNDQDDGEPEWVAMSAACTHMGCIVAWNGSDRNLHCPCHAGMFTRYGKVTDKSKSYTRALPRMEVRVQNGQVWVQVPTLHTTGGSEQYSSKS
jgi:Rieske Fe-S protein